MLAGPHVQVRCQDFPRSPSDLSIPSPCVREFVPCPATLFRPDFFKVIWCVNPCLCVKESCIHNVQGRPWLKQVKDHPLVHHHHSQGLCSPPPPFLRIPPPPRGVWPPMSPLVPPSLHLHPCLRRLGPHQGPCNAPKLHRGLHRLQGLPLCFLCPCAFR